MGSKFTGLRANPPICWICDRKLFAGGRSFVLISDNRPAHRDCAEKDGHEYVLPSAQAAGKGGG